MSKKGKPFREMEGRAGCMIITYTSTNFVNNVYKNENGGYRQLNAEEVKCGDYVAVKTNVAPNGNKGSVRKSGLYVNAKDILFLGYGAEIVSEGADPETTFAGFQAMQFQGMTAQPMMNPSAPMPPAQGYAPPPPAQGYTPPPPVQMPPPAHDFVQNTVGNGYAPNVGQPIQQGQYAPPTGYATTATQSPSEGLPPGIPQR
jgi:hypothetical protein